MKTVSVKSLSFVTVQSLSNVFEGGKFDLIQDQLSEQPGKNGVNCSTGCL